MLGFLFVVQVLASSNTSFAQGYSGQDFWLAFPPCAASGLSSPLRIKLVVSSDFRTTGQLNFGNGIAPIKVQLQHGASVDIDLDSSLVFDSPHPNTEQVAHLILDNYATVTVIEYRESSSESYQAIPTPKLGTRYRLLGFSGQKAPSLSRNMGALLIATEDGTQVTIEPTVSIFGPDSNLSYPAHHTVSFFLHRGECFGFGGSEASFDLTGSLVVATHPIACLITQSAAEVPVGTQYPNMLMEMQPPSSSAGVDFIVPSLPRGKSYVLRTVADRDSTFIQLNDGVVATLKAGESWTSTELSQPASIHSSSPITLAQLCTGAMSGHELLGAPFLTNVAPISSWVHRVEPATLMGGRWENFLTLVCDSNDLSHLVVDGHKLDSVSPTAKVIRMGQSPWSEETRETMNSETLSKAGSYVVLKLKLQPGTHSVSSDRTFAAYQYGYGLLGNSLVAYGNTCGEEIK